MTAKCGTITSNDESLPAAQSVTQWVITEETRFQVRVIDEEGRVHDGLRLTLAMDAYSRAILEFHLGFDREDRSEDRQALRSAMSPREHLEKFDHGLAGACPFEGTSEGALTVGESMAAVMNTRFAPACGSLRVSDETTNEVSQAHKGSAERALVTMVGQFADLLPGGSRFDAIQWKLREHEQDACMTLEEARLALRRWIAQIYHLTPHRNLERKTPVQKWAEGVRKRGHHPPLAKYPLSHLTAAARSCYIEKVCVCRAYGQRCKRPVAKAPRPCSGIHR